MKMIGFFLVVVSLLSILLANSKTESRKLAPEFESNLSSASVLRPSQTSMRIKLKKRQTYEGYHKASFSPDGELVALMTQNKTDVIEVSTNRLVHRINPPSAFFFSVIFSPDGRYLVTSYAAGSSTNSLDKLTIWETSTWREIRTLIAGPSAYSSADNLSFTEDNRWLASHTGGVARLWVVDTGRKVQEFLPPSNPAGLTPMASLVSPDGNWIAVDFGDPIYPLRYRKVHVYEIETGRETVLETEIYKDWRVSLDSTMLAIGASVRGPNPGVRPVVAQIWEAGSWTLKKTIEVPEAWRGALTLVFSPDNEMLAIGGNKKFGLFSIETGELLASNTHTSGSGESILFYDLTWIEFSPDGKSLLTGGNDNTVKLWKIKNKSTQQ